MIFKRVGMSAKTHVIVLRGFIIFRRAERWASGHADWVRAIGNGETGLAVLVRSRWQHVSRLTFVQQAPLCFKLCLIQRPIEATLR